MAKGILVILMVVYHSLNYTNQYHLAFRYLSFLPPSFILITGILIALVYYPRYRDGDNRIWLRLASRGAKLLVLFTILNLAAQFVRSPVYGQSQSIGVSRFLQQWREIFIFGDGRMASFEVLLPIAYLLVLAPGLIWLAHRHFPSLVGVTLALVAGCAILSVSDGVSSNLAFLSVGLVGVVTGRLLRHPEAFGRSLLIAIAAYAVYFPLSVSRGYVYLVQLAGAGIALVLICSVALRVEGNGWWHRRLIRIGQYSLLSYIAQIGILQVLSRFIGRPDPLSLGALLLFFGTLLPMVAIVEVTELLRRRMRVLDQLYRFVFG